MLAAASSEIISMVRGPQRPAVVLGVAAPALYLRSSDGVLAVITSDAVRMPCAVVLPYGSREFSLREVPPDGFVTVGSDALRWTSAGRPITVEVVREWLPARVRPVAVQEVRVAELRAALAPIDIGIDLPSGAPESVVGLGPGLTPSGDDVLAGYLLACRAFGAPVPSLPDLGRTTALSGALLRYAERGVCIPQLAAVLAALGGDSPVEDALDALLAVGATSGAALAAGVLRGAEEFAGVAA